MAARRYRFAFRTKGPRFVYRVRVGHDGHQSSEESHGPPVRAPDLGNSPPRLSATLSCTLRRRETSLRSSRSPLDAGPRAPRCSSTRRVPLRFLTQRERRDFFFSNRQTALSSEAARSLSRRERFERKNENEYDNENENGDLKMKMKIAGKDLKIK